MHDYGERQPRVDYLLKKLRRFPPDKVLKGVNLKASEAISEIEQGTLRGRSIVATAGLVFQAVAATPERFQREP